MANKDQRSPTRLSESLARAVEQEQFRRKQQTGKRTSISDLLEEAWNQVHASKNTQAETLVPKGYFLVSAEVIEIVKQVSQLSTRAAEMLAGTEHANAPIHNAEPTHDPAGNIIIRGTTPEADEFARRGAELLARARGDQSGEGDDSVRNPRKRSGKAG